MGWLEGWLEGLIAESEREYCFDIGQEVRILKSLESDTHKIMDMLGEKGIVARRGKTASENWYTIKVGDRLEDFREYELDHRFKKKYKREGKAE